MRRCLTCEGRFEPRRLICPSDKDMLIDEGLPAAETGTVLEDRFRLGNLLGEGGMGKVFEATSLQTGEVVAVKLLKLDRSRSSEERAVAEKRFRREAEAAAAVESPGIVRTLDIARTPDGQCYMVLERLFGATFDELRRAGKFAELERVVELMREVCEIIALAHRRGIVHRDLKPSNLFLHRVDRERSQVKILDFGIAKFIERSGDQLTSTGEFLGTLLYMAPEQASGQPVGKALDVYTLGIILFQVLAGRVPFDARNPLELLRLHASVPAPSIRTLRPDVSSEVDEVVARCLAKRPDARYADAGALAAALGSIRKVRAADESLDRTSTLQSNASHWVGTVLEDRYELQEWVSRGRFGSDVYRAIHLRTDANVAVRLWRTGTGPVRDCLLEAFRREAQAMNVRHPNVIPILDLGFNESCVYIVTDLVESISLRELISRKAPLPYDITYRLVRGAAGALGALHSRGIVSGGLSPETTRVTGSLEDPRELLISPFGLKSLPQMGLLFQQFGTLQIDDRSMDYISPEQKTGGEPDARSDLYSLAVIAFETLGAKLENPTVAATRTVTEIAGRRKRGEDETTTAEPEVVLPPWIPPAGLGPELEAFFSRATHPSPAERFSSVEELLEALPQP